MRIVLIIVGHYEKICIDTLSTVIDTDTTIATQHNTTQKNESKCSLKKVSSINCVDRFRFYFGVAFNLTWKIINFCFVFSIYIYLHMQISKVPSTNCVTKYTNDSFFFKKNSFAICMVPPFLLCITVVSIEFTKLILLFLLCFFYEIIFKSYWKKLKRFACIQWSSVVHVTFFSVVLFLSI